MIIFQCKIVIHKCISRWYLILIGKWLLYVSLQIMYECIIVNHFYIANYVYKIYYNNYKKMYKFGYFKINDNI